MVTSQSATRSVATGAAKSNDNRAANQLFLRRPGGTPPTIAIITREACRNRLLRHLRQVDSISLSWASLPELADQLRMDPRAAEIAIDELVYSGQAIVTGDKLRPTEVKP